MPKIEFPGGMHINDAAIRLIGIARSTGEFADADFNGVYLVADADTTKDDLVRYFHTECERGSLAWRESPEGKASERRRLAKVDRLSRRRDELMAKLPSLDFGDVAAVMGWLAAIRAAGDLRDVKLPHGEIVAALEAHGFAANANVGDAFDGDDRENVARWLIGQALDGLRCQVHAIHPIFNQFADDWREKFEGSGTEG